MGIPTFHHAGVRASFCVLKCACLPPLRTRCHPSQTGACVLRASTLMLILSLCTLRHRVALTPHCAGSHRCTHHGAFPTSHARGRVQPQKGTGRNAVRNTSSIRANERVENAQQERVREKGDCRATQEGATHHRAGFYPQGERKEVNTRESLSSRSCLIQ